MCIYLLQLFFVFSDFLNFDSRHRNATKLLCKRNERKKYDYNFVHNQWAPCVHPKCYVYIVCVRCSGAYVSKWTIFIEEISQSNRRTVFFHYTQHYVVAFYIFFCLLAASSPCIFDSDNFHRIFLLLIQILTAACRFNVNLFFPVVVVSVTYHCFTVPLNLYIHYYVNRMQLFKWMEKIIEIFVSLGVSFTYRTT